MKSVNYIQKQKSKVLKTEKVARKMFTDWNEFQNIRFIFKLSFKHFFVHYSISVWKIFYKIKFTACLTVPKKSFTVA